MVYGSDDAGLSIKKTNETMNKMFQAIGQILNLKEHKFNSTSIIGPIDVEGINKIYLFIYYFLFILFLKKVMLELTRNFISLTQLVYFLLKNLQNYFLNQFIIISYKQN